MKKTGILMVIYILLVAVYGALTADAEFANLFQGSKMIAWYAILVVFHGLIIWLTNVIMQFFGSIFIKMANKEVYDKKVAKAEVLDYMLVIYFVRIVLVYLGYFLNLPSSIAYISIISALIVCYMIYKKEKYVGWKKLLVMLPFVAYIIMDIASLLTV